MTKYLSWAELKAVPKGARLVFPDSWDIYPYCIVPAGTLCTVQDNDLALAFPVLLLLPDDKGVREDLSEWDGCIQFCPLNDGYEWTDASPVALAGEA